MTGAYDAPSKTLYWSTGNPAPLFNGDARKGDNLYSDSILALDVETGAIRWHFQANGPTILQTIKEWKGKRKVKELTDALKKHGFVKE